MRLSTACFRLNLLLAAGVSMAWSVARSAEDKPPDEAFDRSSLELRFQVPDSFTPSGSDRKYVKTDTGPAPCLDTIWKHNGDSIVTRLMVIPGGAWEKPPSEMFAAAQRGMLSIPSLRVVSEHGYKVDDHPAHSVIISFQRDKPMFSRMDFVLNKPIVHVVMYISPNEAALKGEASKALFQSISIKPKETPNLR